MKMKAREDNQFNKLLILTVGNPNDQPLDLHCNHVSVWAAGWAAEGCNPYASFSIILYTILNIIYGPRK